MAEREKMSFWRKSLASPPDACVWLVSLFLVLPFAYLSFWLVSWVGQNHSTVSPKHILPISIMIILCVAATIACSWTLIRAFTCLFFPQPTVAVDALPTRSEIADTIQSFIKGIEEGYLVTEPDDPVLIRITESKFADPVISSIQAELKGLFDIESTIEDESGEIVWDPRIAEPLRVMLKKLRQPGDTPLDQQEIA